MKNILTITILCVLANFVFSQNMGIDNSSPQEKLHVIGDFRVSTGQINSDGESLQLMQGVRADDTNYEWIGFYSGTTRQGIILYDGQWSGANNVTNEFSITAENSNLLTLNTSGNHIALMPDGTNNVGIGTLAPGQKLDVIGNVSVPGNLGYSIYSWANNDANWRIGMSNAVATVGFSRVLATSHIQYLTFASGAGQGFAVGDVSSDLSAFEVTGSGSSYAAYFRGTIRSEPLAGTANRAVYASSNGTLIASPNFAYVVDRTARTHSATDGVYTMSNSTGDLAVSVGDVISINTSFKFAFTGGSGNDDVFFILNITGCATTTQQDSYYHQNFDNDRNELQPISLQWVYVSTCNGNLQFNLRVNHTANGDDAASTADVVIVATRY